MMGFRTTSLRQRIAWVMLLTAFSTLLLSGAALFVLAASEFRDSLTREINSVAEVVGANSKAALVFDDRKTGTEMLAELEEDNRVVAAAIYSADGKIFSTYTSPLGAGLLPAAPRVIERPELLTIIHSIMHDGKEIGTVLIVASRQEIEDRLRQYSGIAAIILLFSLLAAYLLSMWLGSVLSRPILSLAKTAAFVSQHNDYSVRAVKESDDETGALVGQFNGMLEEIEKKSVRLQENEKQLRLIADSVPMLIAYVDADETYQFNNAGYEKWFGLPAPVLRGMKVRDVIGEKAYQDLSPYIRTALSGQQVAFETAVVYKDGKARWISCAMIPNFADGIVCGYFITLDDISERKRNEDEVRRLNEQLEQRVAERTHELELSQERLRHSERLASIGTLAAGVAHEIRNPLNSISLIAQVALRYNGTADPKLQDMFTQISSESKRCAAIIKNILLFAKSEKTEKTAGDLNEVIRHATDLARSYLISSKAEINLRLQDGALMAKLNTTEIEQVMVNLINNAAEASPAGVKIDISTQAENGLIQVIVHDSGPGISPNILPHIFDPFFSTKRQKGNTGLGLSLSHGIVADHSGTMSVQSEIGRGTTFTIEIPRVM